MLKRILAVDYDALTSYLLTRSDLDDDPGSYLEFDAVQAHLLKEVEKLMTLPEDDRDCFFNPELLDILMDDLGPDTVISATVTKGVGIVTRRGDHLLKLPLILIEAEWRLECQL